MKTIIAGSRSIADLNIVPKTIQESGFQITELVCGMAKGIDTLGLLWAQKQNIPIKKFPANWSLYGRSAGFLRNEQMAQYGEALIAIWDGKSPGTKSMINLAKKYNLKVFIKIVNQNAII